MKTTQVLLFMVGIGAISCNWIRHEASGNEYQIMYKAEEWTKARDTCVQHGAKLAVPKSKDEFLFIQKLVRGVRYSDIIGSQYKLLLWLGVSNLDDYKVWKNVDGENIKDTGFHSVVSNDGDEPGPGEAEPHCMGLDAVNLGLRSYWCHRAQAYVCQLTRDK